ncbi:tetraspanin-15 isoform X1 [Anolis carolinensis]|uniref:tetraspanin-15 isoform X1 n=1 Tax=Anolis carolinensis TaxID=28377 RepID=UPI002F2B8874
MGWRGLRAAAASPAYFCLKFSLSAYATLFALIGLVVLCVGIYAEVERQKHRTLEGLFLAPAILLLLLGLTMFAVSFVGMVGSLRDNRTMLKTFFWVLLTIFIIEMLLLFIEIIFEKQMHSVFHASLRDGIKHYYDDLDFKNILDFVQQKFSCCGGDEFKDWRVNPYHACNGSGALACGVPYTCCIHKEKVINTLCGYRTLDKEVLGLVMAWLYWQELDEMHESLDMVDFKRLDLSSFDLEALDLTGAGWCWCLPREGGYLPVRDTEEEEEEEEGGTGVDVVGHAEVEDEGPGGMDGARAEVADEAPLDTVDGAEAHLVDDGAVGQSVV